MDWLDWFDWRVLAAVVMFLFIGADLIKESDSPRWSVFWLVMLALIGSYIYSLPGE